MTHTTNTTTYIPETAQIQIRHIIDFHCILRATDSRASIEALCSKLAPTAVLELMKDWLLIDGDRVVVTVNNETWEFVQSGDDE